MRAEKQSGERCGFRSHFSQAGHRGKLKAGLMREFLDGLWKSQTFRLHDEVENVAVLARREVEPPTLLVVHEKGRGLL